MGNLETMQRDFAAHIRDPENQPAPEGIEDRRMAIYRELFFNNISEFLGDQFPIVKNILGEDKWTALARDFYRDHGSKTPLFTELPDEFLSYLQNERAQDHPDDPPFMPELAHYERVETVLNLAPDPAPDTELSPQANLLDTQPVLSELARLLSYDWPVHEIAADNYPAEPSTSPHHFLVYRNRAHKVVFNTINSFSARLLQLIEQNSETDDSHKRLTGRELLNSIAAEAGQPADVMEKAGKAMLDQWRELGVVAGGRNIR